MAWGLTEEQQGAIMDAAWAAVEPWWRQNHHTVTVTWVEEDGTEVPRVIQMAGIADDAPEPIKALAKVHGEIVESGFGVL
jgi:hypothetical protein